MVYFVGAGPGAIDLITVRGKTLLEKADTVVYAGSLVNPELLGYVKKSCEIFDSASMTLEEVTDILIRGHRKGQTVIRLHTGDQSIYGAVREQMDILRLAEVPFESVPGVSSFCAAAAAINAEYTLPEVSQTLILTRVEGQTKVPAKEELSLLASHNASMVIFLSVSNIHEVCEKLIDGGYDENTPAAVIYKASWPEEVKIFSTIRKLPDMVKEAGISKTALILIGRFLGGSYERSKLYDPLFSNEFRKSGKEIT